jgi:ATP-binding cassette subfamily B protein/subfamily B ATP-binding cassette protein MsbA
MRRWGALAAALLTLLLRVGVDVLKPWPVLFLVDYGLSGKVVPNWLWPLISWLPGAARTDALISGCVLATIGLFLLSWAVGLAHAYATVSLGQRMVYDLAGQLFARLQQQSLRYHARQTIGDTLRRVTTDCGCVATIARDALFPVVSAVVSLTIMFVIMARVSPALTLLALAVVPYMMWVFRLYAQPMMDRSYAQQTVEGRIYSLVEQILSAMPVVQAFTREEANHRLLQRAHRDTVAAALHLTDAQLRFKILMGLGTALGTAAILWLGARRVLAGETTVGTILLFLSYLAALYTPMETVMYTSAILQGAAGSAARVWDVLDAPQEVADQPGAVPLRSVRGAVRFEDVTFGYEQDRPALRSISLDVAPGEVIAFVGPSGAGKSTLAGLVPRFHDPWKGRVLLDGHDVRRVQLRSLRQQIGLVLQEPFLFPQSIAANIAYGRPKATRAEIEAAARAARAHDFIERLPRGYATRVGERGATLSGGERQRLSIARALLTQAPILIFDEPTSALDGGTEERLLDALEHLLVGRTTLIIAHRLSTVRRAHRVVFLQDGRIVEAGPHAEMLARGGAYAAFCQYQFESEASVGRTSS